MQIVGHRGAAGLAPENTLAAFMKGLKYGVNELECDLRVTKDNIVVISHDASLHDPDGNNVSIKDHSYEELVAHQADLMTFEELLKSIGGKPRLYLEVKPNEPTKPIIDILSIHLGKVPPESVKLASFDQEVLESLHQAFPGLATVVIESWSSFKARHRAKELNTKYLAMNQKYLWFGFIKAMSHRGYKLYAYTLNDPTKANKWAKYGLYAVVTDYPDKFAKI
jgi:glycerophosphoryl diester phosphodiesterase